MFENMAACNDGYIYLCTFISYQHCVLFFFLQLLEDPIFIPIFELEMHSGKPAEFLTLVERMQNGETGTIFFPKARDGKMRVSVF